MTHTLRIPCVLMRGGTSRGLVFRREDLPAERADWDVVFLAAIGSPDVRQLDGVGAGDSHTSKVAVVNRAAEPGADVDYYFGEVDIEVPRVDTAANSGNLIAALGLYALEEGWVPAREPYTEVRVRNLNTGKPTVVRVPVEEGRAAEDGEFTVDGVPGFGPRIDLVFPHPEGAVTGRLLPTGEPVSTLEVPGVGAVQATLLDAANPVVLVDGRALGAWPQTPVGGLNADTALLEHLQSLRGAAAVAMGLVPEPSALADYSAMIPFPVLLFPPTDTPRFDRPGAHTPAEAMDLCVRVLSLGRIHKSVNVTVSVALTAAALLEDTLAWRLSEGAARDGTLRIGHPSGVVETTGRLAPPGEAGPAVEEVAMGRTARRIMQGEVLVQPFKQRYLRGLLHRPA